MTSHPKPVKAAKKIFKQCCTTYDAEAIE